AHWTAGWRSWGLPGVGAAFALSRLAFVFRTGPMEADLARRAETALSAAGHGWATLQVSGRDGVLMGTAPNAPAQGEALAIVRDVRGLRAVFDDTGLVPVVRPFRWSIVRQGPTLTIDGHFPTEAMRQELEAIIARIFPTAETEDRAGLARGAPEGFVSGARFALDLLSRLTEGRAELTDGLIGVSGTAVDLATF